MPDLQLSPFEDKAIKFMAMYDELIRACDTLAGAEIDVSKARDEAKAIKTQVDSDVLHKTRVSEIERIYDEGIRGLAKIADGLKGHELYFDAYFSADNLQRDIDTASLNSEQLKVFAGAAIGLLKQINGSDTRDYKKEENVVDKVYDVAYNMMKMEILATGKSTVLEYAKADEVVSSYFDTRVLADIDTVPEDSSFYSEIRQMIKDIKNSSINYSCLDEGLILLLAMKDSNNMKKVEDSLFEAMNELYASEAQEVAQNEEISYIKSRIDDVKAEIKKSRLYKQIGLTLGLIAVVIGIKQGSETLAKRFGHNEYRTFVDYYSSIGAEAPTYPEYMKAIDNYSSTTLTAYGVWNRENIFYGDYQRKVVVFDLSKVDLLNLEDYGDIDFSKRDPKSKVTEPGENLTAADLYNEAIVEILRITQDPNDVSFVPDEEAQHLFLTIAASVNAALACFGSGAIAISIFKKLGMRFKNGKFLKADMVELEAVTKKFEALSEHSEEFAKKFIENYQRFEGLIRNRQLQDSYERILQKRKNNK